MGRVVQKRLVRKLDLELSLSQIGGHPTPKPGLEQYTISADVAATIIYLAAYTYGDIIGKTVLDLGCGTGRLGLGAAFVGAKQVVGVDIHKPSVAVASENAARAGFRNRTQWIVADIGAVRGDFDTVLQNPPFGVQKRGADRRFLEKALETGRVIYSLHKSTGMGDKRTGRSRARQADSERVHSTPFLEEFIESLGGRVRSVHPMVMTIPHLFPFHTKKKHEFMVDLYVIERR